MDFAKLGQNKPRDRETVSTECTPALTSPRKRGEVGDEAIAKSPGEGDSPRALLCRESPSPARKMLATSPRKRGEVTTPNTLLHSRNSEQRPLPVIFGRRRNRLAWHGLFHQPLLRFDFLRR